MEASHMNDVSVLQNGQIRIPAGIRRKYGILPGTRICFIERENEVAFQPVTKKAVRDACGILKGESSATEELLKVRAKDRKREDEKTRKVRTR
jgi:AbrB family looped-hinge helix DNA binding protein